MVGEASVGGRMYRKMLLPVLSTVSSYMAQVYNGGPAYKLSIYRRVEPSASSDTNVGG